MQDRGSQALLQLQSDVLKAVALGQPLRDVAVRLCRQAESLAPDVVCSVLRVDDGGCLRPLAAPNIPDHYSAAINGLPIGPVAGSCGTAAYRGEEVIVTDIATDPLWAPFKTLALDLGLRACWSSPIIGEGGRVIATFAFYWRECRGPDALERRIVETCVDLLSIAIRHDLVQAEISELAFLDKLSGLPNRTSFESFASDRLMRRDKARVIGIHYVDLDDFKTVNDTLGHRVGDLLLAAVAERLSAAMPRDAMVARLGGDEFAVCVETETAEEQAAIAVDLLASLHGPIRVDGHSLVAAASIGVALAPGHGDELDRLSQRADTALYAAKRAGRNTFRLFSDEMARAVEERGLLKSDLVTAVKRGELSVVYQPILDLESGAVASFEALVRWKHPAHGSISPDRFIPLAEETGVISDIGSFVLNRALDDAALWPVSIGLSVNVSPVQLEDPSFAVQVAAALARAGIVPQRLVIEITETALLERTGTTPKTLDALKTLGVGIALDDFGTGYSSLSLIRDRRFNRLKIDKTFVDGLGTDPDCEAIVRSTLAIARATGFRTTGEGIETADQLDWLRVNGCDEGQGYVLSRPMPAAEIYAWLASMVDLKKRA